MTDAELIAQLRNSKGWPTLGHAAADRIEALAALHQAAVQDALAAEAYAEELEANLAKAEWLLNDALVQLREGKIRTRRNRADLIDKFLDDLKGNTDD